jgi:hypothetical protein
MTTAKNIICGREVEVTILGKYSDTQTEVRHNNKNFVVSNTDLTINNKSKDKFTSKIAYTVSLDKDDYTNEVTDRYRYFDLTITAIDEDTASKICDNCIEYIVKNANFEIRYVGCPAIDELNNNKVQFCDSIAVYDKEEYKEIKELYTEWKKLYK